MSIIHYDHETGELILETTNKETGEVTFSAGHRRPHFQIPKEHLSKKRFSHKRDMIKEIPIHPYNDNPRYRILRQKILSGCNKTSHRLFLIPPTILCFPTVITVLVIILEVAIHLLCHKKNKTLQDSNLYYRSPLHVLTREFCAICRDHQISDRIGRMQDQRRHNYDYIRGMVS